MIKLAKINIVSILFTLFAFGRELPAQSEVGGIQSGVWTVAKSPYIVISDVLIPKGLVLKIEAGVVVKFAGNYQIAIRGGLIAQGDKTKPIVFTSRFDKEFAKDKISTAKIPQPGVWKGIDFLDECDDYITVLNYCIIRYSNWGIRCSNCSPLLTNIALVDIEQHILRINNSDYPFEPGQWISPVTQETRSAIAQLPEPAPETDRKKVKQLLEQQQLKLEQARLKSLQDSLRRSNKVKPVFTKTGKITLDTRIFDQFNIHSINELLGYLPGFSNIATIWTNGQVTSRGIPPTLASNRLLFKINDIPFYEPITKTSYLDLIPLDGIEQIEIERGTTLSQLNHHGIAGSVNFIPQYKTTGLVNKSQIEWGSFGAKKLSAFLGLNRDSTLLNLSTNFMNNSGYWRPISHGGATTNFQQKYASDRYNFSVFLKRSSWNLFVSYFENDQFQLGLLPQMQYDNPINRQGLVLSICKTIKINSQLYGKVTTNYVQADERSQISNTVASGLIEAEAADHFLSEGKLLTVSVLSQYQRPSYLATAGITVSRFFVEPLFDIKDREGKTMQQQNWVTTSRIVNYEHGGFLRLGYNFSPFWGFDGKSSIQFTNSVHQPDFALDAKIIYNPFLPVDSYLKYSRATRTATLLEKYISVPGLIYGNADLNSEKFEQWEWCTDLHLKPELRLGLVLFRSKNSHVIELTPAHNFENNDNTFQTAGFEFVLDGKISDRSLLLTNVSYDFQQSSRWRYPQLKIQGLANIHWLPGFSTITAIQYLSQFETDIKFGPYYVMNLFFVYQLLPRIKIAIKCFDLLDQHPENPDYIRGEMAAIPSGPGRCFYIATTIE